MSDTTKDELSQEYCWEIKDYTENPTQDRLMDLLQLVYGGGYWKGWEEGYDDAAD